MHCQEFRKYLARGSLAAHCQTQHGVARGGSRQEGDKESGDNELSSFSMAFPVTAGPRPFPVEVFSGRVVTRTAMWVHLWHLYVRYTVVILEEVNLPHPW